MKKIKLKKKSQVSIEFISFLGTIAIIFVIFVYFMSEEMNSNYLKKEYEIIKDLGESLQLEIAMAANSETG